MFAKTFNPALPLTLSLALALTACNQGTATPASAAEGAAAIAAESIAPDYAVRGQIALADVAAIKAAGFRTLINNRPDGEEPGQPSSAQIGAEAQRLGLRYHYVPVAHTGATEADAALLKAALKDVRGPTLAYCRSGRRAAAIKAMADALP